MSILEHRPEELKRRVERQLPRCVDFVSRFWCVSKDAIEPREVLVEPAHFWNPHAMASMAPKARILRLYAGHFDKIVPDSILSYLLAHELGHAVYYHVRGHSRGGASFVLDEGLATFTAEMLMDQTLGKRISYDQYRLFRRLGWDGCDSDMQVHIRTIPYMAGLFFFSTVLGSMGEPASMLSRLAKDPPDMDGVLYPRGYLSRRPAGSERTWVEEAVGAGIRSYPQIDRVRAESIFRPVNPLGRPSSLLGYAWDCVRTLYYSVRSHHSGHDQGRLDQWMQNFKEDLGFGFVYNVDTICKGRADEMILANPPTRLAELAMPELYFAIRSGKRPELWPIGGFAEDFRRL